MPRTTTHLAVENSHGQVFPSMAVAYRTLAGTIAQLGHSEHRTIRARLRNGERDVSDSHGTLWNTVEVVQVAVANWTDFTFGVEIEYIGRSILDVADELRRAGFTTWRVVRDGSVYNGGEVVSPVLQGEAGMRDLKAVLDTLNDFGCKVDRSCGLHVHIGVRDRTVSQITNICRAFKAHEGFFDSIVAPSRRGNANRYCQSHAAHTASGTYRTMSGLARDFNGGVNTSHYGPYRYRKLNLQSYARQGTIEFRQHHGSVDSAKVTAWVRLITGFCAANLNAAQSVDFDGFAAFAGERSEFIKQRRAFFEARDAQRAAA